MKKPLLAKLIRVFARRKRKLQARIARKLLQLSAQTDIADSAKISHLARFDLVWNAKRDVVLSIGKRSNIKDYAILAPREGFIRIGEDCSINPFCVLLGYGGITIGNKVRIAAHGAIIAFNHNFDDPTVSILEQGNNFKGIHIEDGAWLGNNVKVLDGVTIGRGAVVGAGSVVTKSVPPMAVVAGVPAKVIKMRTSEADLSDLPE